MRNIKIMAFISLASSMLLMAGCSKQEEIKEEESETFRIRIPKSIEAEEVQKSLEDIIQEQRKKEFEETSNVSLQKSELEKENTDPLQIAAELNFIWGPEEKIQEYKSPPLYLSDQENWSNSWRTMTPEEIKIIENASDAKSEKEAGISNEEESEKSGKVPKTESIEKDDHEREKESDDLTEDIEKSHDSAPEEKDKKSQEQQILAIVATVNKYTSKKGQTSAFLETLSGMKNTEENLDILIDLKLFLPKSFHTTINEKIAEIIALQRKNKES